MKKAYQDIHRELIELSNSGNTRAQFQLYSLYSKAMFNVCLRLLNDRGLAEDALQDAFCEVFRKLDTFRFQSSFGAWVKKIIVNTCLNHLKKRNFERVFVVDFEAEKVVSEEENDINEMNLSVERIKSSMSLLPEGYRVVLSLYLFEGYDHKEISEILGISESTSKTQYMKAKKKLKLFLKDNR